MSVSVEEDTFSPIKGVQNGDVQHSTAKNHSSESKNTSDDIEAGHGDNEKSEPGTPKTHPMAFTIDFAQGKSFDKSKLEKLAKQSQARHQRVQSMSASLTRPSPVAQKPPMSVKLPRKAQGYNSEGYFSSDQEDSVLSGSVKLRQSPLGQNVDKNITSPTIMRHLKSPDFTYAKVKSKSPIVDSIMSRSDIFPSRQSLNLPLKQTNGSYIKDVHRTPSYGNLSSSYQLRHTMADIIDQSPEGIMLTDISSPELDILTPDNGLSTPEHRSPYRKNSRRASSETLELFQRCSPKVETLYIDDDEVDRQSENSSTGTYTIEADNYTEEQKARMSIDRTFGANISNDVIEESLQHINRDPDLIFDHPKAPKVITKEPRRDVALRSPTNLNQGFPMPSKVSNEKNVLEISCCYESPTESDLATQTSKQIKSTRSYLEKIKNRVKNITEKTFSKSPPKHDHDLGSFTSVTTSGVLSTRKTPQLEFSRRRRCSLTKSEIDQTDYVHRLSRETSVPVCLPSTKPVALEETQYESTALRNAHAKALRDDSGVSSDITPEAVVGKLSFLSLNRCKGDKTWIQEWADSVKKYNNNTLAKDEAFLTAADNEPAMSTRHMNQIKCIGSPRNTRPNSTTPTKIPSPVGTLRTRVNQDVLPSSQDTESYLQRTQNAITNLQAKLQSSRTNPGNIPSQLTSSLISEKTAMSRLPVSQLSRSNSLNYRLRRKEQSGDSSPLRSPGHYVITGSGLPASTKLLINNASRSLETDRRKDRDSNMNSPSSDRGLLSNSSDDKTLSNRTHNVESLHRKTHTRHRSFDGRNAKDYLVSSDVSNANNQGVSLKTVLKNNALEAQHLYLSPTGMDQTRCQGDGKRGHQRVLSDNDKAMKRLHGPTNYLFGASIKRSSSFNTVNKNNNYLDPSRILNSRRSSGNSEARNEYKDTDYLSDESDNGSYEKSQETRFKRPVVHRSKLESPDLKSKAPANSPRCPNTPEMQRKFGPGLVRASVRVTNKERGLNTRIPDSPIARDDRQKPTNHQSRRVSEPTRQAVLNRLTKSRSSTREFQPKPQEKGRKPTQYRSASALASKEMEFTNWKKRSSYDPMKSAMEGKKRQQQLVNNKRQQCNKDDLSSPSHSSPVHRSQSFHTTNMADLETLDYSSEETEEEQLLSTLPMDHAMITSTHSDILDLRPRTCHQDRRHPMSNDVVLARDYVTNFQIHPHPAERKRRDLDKRKTFIVDDTTPTRENVDFLKTRDLEVMDKRKTFILDSDTNSTTNGSSPRNSSVFSHEKNSLTTCTSDTDAESGTESGNVVMRHPGKRAASAHPNKRHSGELPAAPPARRDVPPRYLDISRHRPDGARGFLRKDPAKTYVAVLPARGAARTIEMEQKKQELEKWKRRASYDPRKAAALGKAKPPRTLSNVLRSQSYHGPMLASPAPRCPPAPAQIAENYDQSSDNDF